MAEFSQSNALFIKFPYTADREKSPWAGESVVPVSKLLGDNPARDYGVPLKGSTVIVCDWFGNDYNLRTDAKKGTPEVLKKLIDTVTKKADDADKKLAKNYDKAAESHGKADSKGSLKLLLRNFKEGYVGLPAQESSIRLYHEIMDATRKQAEEMRDNGDEAGLKSLGKDFKGTDVEKDIAECLKNIVRRAPADPTTQEKKG